MKNILTFLKSKYFLKHILLMFVFVFLAMFLFSKILDIYTHHSGTLEMPDFRNVSIYELERFAKEKDVEYVIIDSMSVQGKAKGIVIEQDPPAGSKIKPGRKVYLTVTTVLPEYTTMPNLIDLSVREALSVLETNGLRLGRVEYVPDIAQNAVLKQRYRGKNIEPGTKLLKGSTITLVLGRGKNDETVAIPNLRGKTRKEAISEINSFQLSIGNEHFASGCDSTKAKVYKQEPEPTEKFSARAGTPIDLWYK